MRRRGKVVRLMVIFGGIIACQGAAMAQCDGAWSALERGISGATRLDVATFDDGGGPALYVGGTFTMAGGLPATGFAKWDGTRWHPVGDFRSASGQPGSVRALLVLDRDGPGSELASLYVGGTFSSVSGVEAVNVARWDGLQWHAVGNGVSTTVYSLGSFRPNPFGSAVLVAGRFVLQANGQLAADVWDGSVWYSIGGSPGPNPPINSFSIVTAMTQFDDGSGPALYVGGYFQKAGTMVVNNLAKWDGVSWYPVGDSSGFIRSLAVWNDGAGSALYMGGSSAGGHAVQKWDGTSLTPVGGLHGFVLDFVELPTMVGNSRLMACRSFPLSTGNAPPPALAVWDGMTWDECSIEGNGSILQLAIDPFNSDSIVVGGAFTAIGGIKANGMARITSAWMREDVWPPLSGDGRVDANDVVAVLARFGESGACDVDGDGVVSVGDVLCVLNAWTTRFCLTDQMFGACAGCAI